MEESQDHVKTDLPVNDQQPDEPIDPFDCQQLPSKDLPVFLSQLKDDENAQLRPPVPVEQLDFTHVQQMIGELYVYLHKLVVVWVVSFVIQVRKD